MQITSYITLPALCLLALALLSVLWLVLVGIMRRRSLSVCRRRCDVSLSDTDDSQLVPASVVIYSRDEPDELSRLLPQVLDQDYPAPFEVIVVNEGDSTPDVRDLVDRLSLTHRNLYLTFTPDGARSLSRKKLALTLGVKAARYPVVVLTMADAAIDSPQWLRSVMRHFADDSVEVVLGATRYASTGTGASFTLTADNARWLAPAIHGHPWRGIEYNLAYRRDTFFRNKGFSRSLNLRTGDDDIFVSEISNARNTRVELSEASLVAMPRQASRSSRRERAMRRIFTERRIGRRRTFLSALSDWASLLAPLCAIAAAVLCPELVAIIAASVLFLAWAITLILQWRSASAALDMRLQPLAVPFLAAARPIARAFIALRSRFGGYKRYTWN